MSKSILREVEQLVQANVISEEVAESIRLYYGQQETKGGSWLIIVFGILGALLVGLGTILIIAHNWDALPKTVQLIIAFLPLLTTQAIAAYIVLKPLDNIAWKEGSATALIFAVAASISLVSQVYHIHGNLGRFLLVWMVLSLPIIYVLRSSLASLLYLIGITWYACETGYFHYPQIPLAYWGLLALALPHYLHLLKTKPESNFTYFHHWMLAGSLTIALGTFGKDAAEWLMPAYMSLLGAFILIGQFNPFSRTRILANGFLVIGSLGTIGILLSLSFDSYWNYMAHNIVFDALEFYVTIAITCCAGYLLFLLIQKHKPAKLNAKSSVFLIFLIIFFVGMRNAGIAQVLINLLLLVLGVFTIREGAMANHLGRLNYGLMILTALIICRFFDVDLSFVVRGLLFILVGAGFFAANYWMVQKRKRSQ